jgi:hypothetical protein
MNVNVNVQRKFKVNGIDYNSVQEMPSDIRSAFKKVMASQTTTGKPTVTHTKIIFNGAEYNSIEAMPQDDRQLYEKVLRAAEKGDIPAGLVSPGDISVSRTEPKVSGDTDMENMRKAIKVEPVVSPRIWIFGTTLIALIILIYYLFQVR